MVAEGTADELKRHPGTCRRLFRRGSRRLKPRAPGYTRADTFAWSAPPWLPSPIPIRTDAATSCGSTPSIRPARRSPAPGTSAEMLESGRLSASPITASGPVAPTWWRPSAAMPTSRPSASQDISTSCLWAPRPGARIPFAGETDAGKALRPRVQRHEGRCRGVRSVAADGELAPKLERTPGISHRHHGRRGNRVPGRVRSHRASPAHWVGPVPSSWPSPQATSPTSVTRARSGSRRRRAWRDGSRLHAREGRQRGVQGGARRSTLPRALPLRAPPRIGMMGQGTLNVGTFARRAQHQLGAGPRLRIGIDMRTVPTQSHQPTSASPSRSALGPGCPAGDAPRRGIRLHRAGRGRGCRACST